MLCVAAFVTTSHARYSPSSECVPLRPKICSGSRSTSSMMLSRVQVKVRRNEISDANKAKLEVPEGVKKLLDVPTKPEEK